MTENKRQIYPDVIKGIAIILVVIGHNIQFGSGGSMLKRGYSGTTGSLK